MTSDNDEERGKLKKLNAKMNMKSSAIFAILVLMMGLAPTESTAAGEGRDHGYQYLSPEPGAGYLSEQMQYVLVRFNDVSPSAVTNLTTDFITVTGAYTGAHFGVTHLASDRRTVIFEMSFGFLLNEPVTVYLSPELEAGAEGTLEPYQYQCMTTGPMPDAITNPPLALVTNASGEGTAEDSEQPNSGPSPLSSASPGHAGIMPNGVSVPSDFPFADITVNTNADPEFFFLNNIGGKPYNIIFDNTGSPVWYQRLSEDRRDMKVQPNGVLTMMARDGGNHFIGLDTNYNQIATYVGVNGYVADEHELLVLEDGTYLLVVIQTNNNVDMSKYVLGGEKNAVVYESAIQEFTSAGELIFQWRSWDHYDVRDLRLESPTAASMHFSHMNAIDVDTDGNILVSCRHLNEVTKINRDSGEIIWRLGGAHSDFTFANDSLNGFENQHSIRTIGTNRYLLFDNGDLHNPKVSRAVEYQLDLSNHTATVVWQYPETPTTTLYSHYMGNVQRLTNGNTLINWSVNGLPKLTEVRPDGTKAFEMNWEKKYQTYRVWRCAWNGMALKPNLVIESYPEYVLLLFNKFGDTNVAYYRIYGDLAPNPTKLVSTSSTTMAELQNLENQRKYFFRVTAVDKDGTESDYSDEATVNVNILKPGENMVDNGDFSLGSSPWYYTLTGTADASWTTADGDSSVDITSPGTQLKDIQVGQVGLKLLQGRKYFVEFDAWADQPRAIEVELGQYISGGPSYAVASAALTPIPRHATFSFTMSETTDLDARLSFYMGASIAGVRLDNVSVYMQAPGDLNQDGCVGLNDLKVWAEQWLRQGNGLTSDLDGNGKVDFSDLDVLGESWSGEGCP